LDHEGGREHSGQRGRTPAHKRQGTEVAAERGDEKREKDHAAGPTVVGPTCVGGHEWRVLDPGAGDTAHDEECDHGGREQRGPAQRAIGPDGYSGGEVGGGVGAGVVGGAGRPAGGARGVTGLVGFVGCGAGSAGAESSSSESSSGVDAGGA
jgi:hypothetical protein